MDPSQYDGDSFFPGVHVTNLSDSPEPADNQTPNQNPQFINNQRPPCYNMYGNVNTPSFSLMPQMTGFDPNLHSQVGGSFSPSTQVPETPSSQKRQLPRTHWNREDDMMLISAWLNVSKDVITGTDQKGSTFWGRIADYCYTHRPSMKNRNVTAIEKHWRTINACVSSYAGVWAGIMEAPQSGYSLRDMIDEAQKRFLLKHPGVTVDYRPHWEVLSKEEKWKCQAKGTGGSKRNKTGNDGSYTSSKSSQASVQPEDEDMNACVRPEGVKAAKRNAKNKGVSQGSSRAQEVADEVNEREKELLETYKSWHMSLLAQADTSIMTPIQREIHEMQCVEAMQKMKEKK